MLFTILKLVDPEGKRGSLWLRLQSYEVGGGRIYATVFCTQPTEETPEGESMTAFDLDFFDNRLQILVWSEDTWHINGAEDPKVVPLVSNVDQWKPRTPQGEHK